MTLRHTREALYELRDASDSWPEGNKYERAAKAAEPEVALVEAVIEAARRVTTMWAFVHTRAHGYPRALIDALAALDAAEKEQA